MKALKPIFILIAVILIIVLFCMAALYAITEGVISMITGWMGDLLKTLSEWTDDASYELKKLFGMSTIKEGMMIYEIDQQNIETLKQTLEDEAIATDKSGMTEVTLRKIVLANAVTSSTQDTLCAVEISEEEALQGTDYDDIDEYFETLQTKKSKSDNVWPIDNVNYTLYFITDSFFYFRDEKGKNGIMGSAEEDDKDKLYLGVMGKISIVNQITGEDFKYVDPGNEDGQFGWYKEKYLGAGEKVREGTEEEKNLLSVYTRTDEGLVVYTIDKEEYEYNYKFNNKNIEAINESGYDEDPEYGVDEKILQLEEDRDISEFAIPIELLMDFLDFTGSPQYVDEFIDYALAEFKVEISAYNLTTTTQTYEKTTYNIADNYIYELYDVVDKAIDIGGDNMITYKPLIYDRTFRDNPFDTSVVDLEDFENIDYGEPTKIARIQSFFEKTYRDVDKQLKYEISIKYDIEQKDITEEITRAYLQERFKGLEDLFKWESEKELNEAVEVYVEYVMNGTEPPINNVSKISSYLKLAYDPSNSFSLGDVTVEESKIWHYKYREWYFTISSISTWFGKITYEPPTKSKYYDIESIEASKEEYDNFGIDSLTEYESLDNETKTRIFISNARAKEIGLKQENDEQKKSNEANGLYIIDEINQSDLYDNIFNKALGKGNVSNFNGWTSRGLGEIAAVDDGKYNNKTGAGSGADYLYSKFTETNKKKYTPVSKTEYEVIEESTNLPQVDVSKAYEFLSLWKNKTGAIGNREYDANGIKVKYDDIYNGQTKVGDIFESSPEMFFTVLESSDNTKSLVDIFKYIMYLYTGIDYGITDESQIAFMFGMSSALNADDYMVNATMSDNQLVLTREQLENAINKSYSGRVKSNLLSCIDDFIYIQNTNKVNAVFAVAVTIIESSGGTNWAAIDPSTYNWYSIKGSYNGNSSGEWRAYPSFNAAVRDFGDLIANGSYYFKAGKYTVSAIAPTYCNVSWGTKVVAEMTKIYNSIGISAVTATGQLTYPVPGHTEISAGFPNYSDGSYHGGIDYPAGIGTTIVAADSGKVKFVKYLNYSYGYHIAIDHGNGMETWYCHMSKIDVKAGQTVQKGQKVGEIGETGNATGPHLHFEVRLDGTRVNPSTYLNSK